MEAGRALWLLICLGSNEGFTHNTGYRALGLEMGRLDDYKGPAGRILAGVTHVPVSDIITKFCIIVCTVT